MCVRGHEPGDPVRLSRAAVVGDARIVAKEKCQSDGQRRGVGARVLSVATARSVRDRARLPGLGDDPLEHRGDRGPTRQPRLPWQKRDGVLRDAPREERNLGVEQRLRRRDGRRELGDAVAHRRGRDDHVVRCEVADHASSRVRREVAPRRRRRRRGLPVMAVARAHRGGVHVHVHRRRRRVGAESPTTTARARHHLRLRLLRAAGFEADPRLALVVREAAARGSRVVVS
eukprot:31074-Pelagococcus_subviridis.AAC.23